MQLCNKQNTSKFLMLTLCAGMATTPQLTPSYGFGFSCSGDNSLLWTVGVATGVTVVGCGIAAACGAFRWSDADILKWIRDGIAATDMKYQQLDQHPPQRLMIRRLELFGNRNKASWSACKTEVDEVTYANPNFAPLHNTMIIINGDLAELRNYQSYLFSRDLLGHAQGRIFNTQIAEMLNNLENLKDIIFVSPEYKQEEHALQPKIHQLRQERLQREHNQALMHQANAQYQQAEALREQARMPREQTNIIIVSENDSQQSRKEKARLEADAERARKDKIAAERRAEEERLERIRAEREAEKLRREKERLNRQDEEELLEAIEELENESNPFNNCTYLDY